MIAASLGIDLPDADENILEFLLRNDLLGFFFLISVGEVLSIPSLPSGHPMTSAAGTAASLFIHGCGYKSFVEKNSAYVSSLVANTHPKAKTAMVQEPLESIEVEGMKISKLVLDSLEVRINGEGCILSSQACGDDSIIDQSNVPTPKGMLRVDPSHFDDGASCKPMDYCRTKRTERGKFVYPYWYESPYSEMGMKVEMMPGTEFCSKVVFFSREWGPLFLEKTLQGWPCFQT
jgi:hypothetical protein